MERMFPSEASRPRKIALLGLVSASLMTWQGTSEQVGADPFGQGPRDGGWPHDGGDHTFCFLPSATPRIQQAARDGMENLDRQAVIADAGPFTCTMVIDARFGNTDNPAVDGSYTCEVRHPSGNCSTAILRLNPANMANDWDWKQTSCHEVGHSVGLTHNMRNDCMAGDPIDGAGLIYDDHHVAHINQQA